MENIHRRKNVKKKGTKRNKFITKNILLARVRYQNF